MAVAQPTIKAQARVTPDSPKRRIRWGNIAVNVALLLICLLWTIPTMGLMISSFRTREDILTTGWWTIAPHQEFVTTSQETITPGIQLTGPVDVNGFSVTDDQLRAGYLLPNGQQVIWANRRTGVVNIQDKQVISNADFSLDNYSSVLTGQQYTYVAPDGTTTVDQGSDMGSAFLNTLVVAIPATVIPILIAAFAAHAFAWMKFPGRRVLFGIVVALLVVPIQVALIPILRDYNALQINGTFLAIWLAHTGFGLPLATYLLYNYISQLPRDLFESAYIDGASPFTVFTRLVLPLSTPALASFAIFQFLWVWNDYLVALIFIGATPGRQVLTMKLADIVGSRGQDWHLLTAGAFVSMIVPLIVFFALQRFFVRGLLAGSVKG
ncbi:MAG TPA: carbohydrate ABC transporter permease [Chloroflexia bacterium]|nr:carbohydrate ABC transporter permease [Chloroflexia bacterium]